MAKQQIDFFRAAYRPRLHCDDCSWTPGIRDGHVHDFREAKTHASNHLRAHPDHRMIAVQERR